MAELVCIRCKSPTVTATFNFILCGNCGHKVEYDPHYYCQLCGLFTKKLILNKSINKFCCKYCQSTVQNKKFKLFKCPKCSRKYRNRTNCFHCDATVTQKMIRLSVMISPSGPKFYYCTECDGKFRRVKRHPIGDGLYCPRCIKKEILKQEIPQPCEKCHCWSKNKVCKRCKDEM